MNRLNISIAALPILFNQKIYRMGFQLGCDWLKEMGYGESGKPDAHTAVMSLIVSIILGSSIDLVHNL
jgi:hypothetical protein